MVVYAGGQADQRIIREHEFYFPSARGRRASGPYRFNVLLTSYETMLRDKAVFKDIKWETVIIDEAHRLKARPVLSPEPYTPEFWKSTRAQRAATGDRQY